MKMLKKGTALLVCLVMMLTLAQIAPKSLAAGEAAAISSTVKEIDYYGNLKLELMTDDFFAAGYDYGDVVTATIGGESMDIPVVDTLMEVDAYQTMVWVSKDKANYPYISLSTNAGNLASDLPFQVDPGLKVTISMKQKGGYLDEYTARQLVRTNERTDYPSLTDEEFANVRVASTTGMGEGVLYRSSSPVDPELNRNTYVMTAIEKYGIKTVLNSNDSDETLKSYATYPGSYYASCHVIPLAMKTEFKASTFEEKFVRGLRYMIENEGPYLVHCVEGKDRTGFICAVLEALMGATADEILDDYMVTFYNYYGVKPGEKRYDYIREGDLPITLKVAFGVSDFYTADLREAAETYMKRIGLTDEEITKLRQRLGEAQTPDNSVIHKLKPNKTYKKYDVTCDGKADKIRVKYKEKKNGNNSMQICIDGKEVYKKKQYILTPDVKILQFDKKNQLIAAGYSGEDDWNSIKLYSYKKKNWKLIRNLNKSGISSKYSFGGRVTIKSITESSVTAEYHHQMPMIGADTFEFRYLYDGKTMTHKNEDVVIKIAHYDGPDYNSNGYENNATLEAKRTMKVYADSSTSSGTVAEIQKDNPVVFYLMRVVSERPWFYVKIGTVTGWLPAGVSKSDDNDNGEEGSGYYFKWLLFYA